MSIKHLNWAFRQKLPTGPKLTLIALCDSLNEEGEWYIKHQTLAEKTSQHRATVIRHIALLVEKGLVEATPTRHKDGRQGYNLYRVAICDTDEKPESQSVKPESQPVTPESQVATPITTHIPPNTHLEGKSLSDEEKIVSNWNIMAAELSLPRVEVLTATRKSHMKARLAEVGIDGFRRAFEHIEESKFCRGQNDKGWRATFDFVISPSGMAKLIEGNYGNE